MFDRESGDPLPYASIQIEDPSGRRGILADADGAYAFEGLRAGEATLRVDFIGYERLEKNLVLAANLPNRYDARLVVAPIALETIEIRADRLEGERKSLPSLVTLDAKSVAAIPALGEQDPIRALQLLPGVQAASDFSSGLYVRGGGPDQTLILLDEVPVYNPTHAFGIFSTFNPDAIDEVRLYKGAYPARYGGRLGAVLDVRNRNGKREGFSGRAGLSTIAGRGQLEGPVGGGSWLVSGRRTYLDPILDALRTDENQIPAYYFYDLNARLSLPGVAGGDWTVTGYLGRDDLFFDLDDDSRLDLRWGNRTASAKVRRPLGASIVGSAQIAASEYESTTDVLLFSTPITVENRLRDAFVAGDLAWAPRPATRITVGAAASSYDFTYGQSFNRNPQIEFAATPIDVSSFTEAEWTTERDATYGLGARLRWFSEGERTLVEPRASASWPVADGQLLKLAGGVYHQYLQLVSTEVFSAGDFYLPVDATAEPPRSLQAVAGWEWSPTERWELSVETFATRLENLLTLDTRQTADAELGTTETTFRTGGTGWASGLELFLQRRTGPITGWVGYTLGWTRRRFDEVNGGEEFPPKYDRRHDLSVVLSHRRGAYAFGGTFVFATGQAYTPATARYRLSDPATGAELTEGRVLPGEKNSARLLPYHRLDVSVTRDFEWFDRPAQVYLQVFNLYNRRNEWFVQFDPQGVETEPEVVRMLPVVPSLGVRFGF